jgi:hypothetical protein
LTPLFFSLSLCERVRVRVLLRRETLIASASPKGEASSKLTNPHQMMDLPGFDELF